MAEEIADDAAGRSPRAKEVAFESAGTFACEGTPASPHAVEVIEEIGLDIGKHKAQQFTKELAEWADIILAMETGHIEEMEAMAPEAEDKMHTLLGYAAGIKGYPGGKEYDITDPYRDPIEDYRETRDQIKAAVDMVLGKLTDKAE